MASIALWELKAST